MFRTILSVLFVSLSLTSATTSAHHAVSMIYSVEQMQTVSGIVEEFRFHNPHCVIFLTRTNAEGAQERWAIEWAGSSALRRIGLTAETLKPGDAITATGFAARDGSTAMALQILDFGDGRPSIRPPDRSGTAE